MVSALIPRVLEGQQGRREARGIILYGDVAAVRVEGSVNEIADFIGDVPPVRHRRSMFADVIVNGKGGRQHVFKDCACQAPVKVGDPVVLEMPYGNSLQGAVVSGLQVPRRPLIFASTAAAAPVVISDTITQLAEYVPVEILDWEQAFAVQLQALVELEWEGVADWTGVSPTPATLLLSARIEGKVEGSWSARNVLTTWARADLSKSAGKGYATFAWSGIVALDSHRFIQLWPEATQHALTFRIDATAQIVKWSKLGDHSVDVSDPLHAHDKDNDHYQDWQATPVDKIIVSGAYNLQVAELGGGTW